MHAGTSELMQELLSDKLVLYVRVGPLAAVDAQALLIDTVSAVPPPRVSVASVECPTVLAQVHDTHAVGHHMQHPGTDPGHSHGSVLARAAPIPHVQNRTWGSDE